MRSIILTLLNLWQFLIAIIVIYFSTQSYSDWSHRRDIERETFVVQFICDNTVNATATDPTRQSSVDSLKIKAYQTYSEEYREDNNIQLRNLLLRPFLSGFALIIIILLAQIWVIRSNQ